MNNVTITKFKHRQFPVITEKDEDGFYTIECPLLAGCYSQGRTLDEAFKNIREVIALCLEERETRQAVKDYFPRELGLHTITLGV